MKKIVLVGVLMGLGLAAVGCDNKKKAATPPPAQAETLTPPAPYIPPQSTVTMPPPDQGAQIVTPPPERLEPAPKPVARRSAPAESSAISAGSTYTVRKGDTLGEIAQRVYGSASKRNVDRIKRANNLKGDTIRVGQKLKIPGASSGTRSGSTGNKN